MAYLLVHATSAAVPQAMTKAPSTLACAVSSVAALLKPETIKEFCAMGDRPLSKRKSYHYLAAGALIGLLISAPLALTQPGRDLQEQIANPQSPAPAFLVADPVWDEEIQRDWWPRFGGQEGRSSLTQTLASLSHSVPADQLPAALRLVIDTASPTLFRSPQAMDAWRQALEGSGRDVGQATAMLEGEVGAEVMAEPFAQSTPMDPEKAWRTAIDHPVLEGLDKPPRRLSMDAARDALEEAVITTGLAGIRVPAPYWEDPKLVWRLAKGLERADAQLSQITGWPSPVLGMGGRVMLTIGAPGDSTVMHTQQGLMDIRADWTSLAHEWFHALDYAMAPELMTLALSGTSYIDQSSSVIRLGRPGGEPYREAFDRLIMDVQAPPLTRADRLEIDLAARKSIRDSINQDLGIYPGAMAQGLRDIDQSILLAPIGQAVPDKGSPWLYWRVQASASQADFDRPSGLVGKLLPMSKPAGYLQNKMEIMAFAFSAHVSARFDQSLLAYSHEAAKQSSPSYRPTLEEAQSLEKAWDGFFARMAPWHRADVQARLATAPPPRIKPISP